MYLLLFVCLMIALCVVVGTDVSESCCLLLVVVNVLLVEIAQKPLSRKKRGNKTGRRYCRDNYFV